MACALSAHLSCVLLSATACGVRKLHPGTACSGLANTLLWRHLSRHQYHTQYYLQVTLHDICRPGSQRQCSVTVCFLTRFFLFAWNRMTASSFSSVCFAAILNLISAALILSWLYPTLPLNTYFHRRAVVGAQRKSQGRQADRQGHGPPVLQLPAKKK